MAAESMGDRIVMSMAILGCLGWGIVAAGHYRGAWRHGSGSELLGALLASLVVAANAALALWWLARP